MQQSNNSNRRNTEKVVYLPNQRNRQRNMAEPLPQPQKAAKSFRIQTVIIMAIGIIGVSLATVPLVQALKESQMVTQELKAVKQEEKEAMQENIQAQEEYKHMQDPDYLADVARRDYYYSKPGEIIFDLEED